MQNRTCMRNRRLQTKQNMFSFKLMAVCLLFIMTVLYGGLILHQKAYAKPERQTYRVMQVDTGMTLWSIAEQEVQKQKLEVTTADFCREIIDINHLDSSADCIVKGDIIFLPIYH
ncbi:MAG: hypothetical protein SPL15_02070 [Lachnospiraceae bacterium]|nr:hypothetical protein [Lachnospiraceae bacterium]MDY5741775.1 hypothetical protein [Lachnospiraceae bacterium]